MTSYISESVGYVDRTTSQWSKSLKYQNEFSSIATGQLSFLTSRAKYGTMTDIEVFNEAFTKFAVKISMSEDDFKTLSSKFNLIPDIKFRNPAAIYYAYRYSFVYKNKEEILKLFKEAEKNFVPPFDVIRYYRFLTNLNILRKIDKPTTISFSKSEVVAEPKTYKKISVEKSKSEASNSAEAQKRSDKPDEKETKKKRSYKKKKSESS